MGLIIDAQPGHGDWRLELRAESFYLTSTGTSHVAVRVHRQPTGNSSVPGIRIPLDALAAFAEALEFVAQSEQYRQRPDVAGGGQYKATVIGDALELLGPMVVYGDDWRPATIEPTYADLPALLSAVGAALDEMRG